MTERDERQPLRPVAARAEDRIREGASFRWTVTLRNTGGTSVHVSAQIQSLSAHPDEGVIEVSTARPHLADNVHVGFFSLPTVTVEPGETRDLEFQLPFPVRTAEFRGEWPQAEIREWMPSGEVEIRTVLAYGEQPFYPPSPGQDVGEALGRWTRTVTAHPVRAPADDRGKGPAQSQNPTAGE